MPSDDFPAFVFALVELANDASLRTRLGQSARQYAEQYLARDTVLGNFEKALKDCVMPAGDATVSSPVVEARQ